MAHFIKITDMNADTCIIVNCNLIESIEVKRMTMSRTMGRYNILANFTGGGSSILYRDFCKVDANHMLTTLIEQTLRL